ncbi:MAG: GNAT family N-acetyltransferase [Deltaproteobacteria bacterium]|nr:GNAT family N-acetyltransferase [Deltaproteobacteria bacterium]
MPQLRAPLPGEGAVLGALLDEAFAEHDEAQRFEPEVMALLLDGPRGGAQLSLVAEDAGRPVAVAFVGRRALRWGAKVLHAHHLGPIGVSPRRRREGLGRWMCEAARAHAEGSGADLLTLTTNPSHPARHLYERLGYTIIERFRPSLRALGPTSYLTSLAASEPWPGSLPGPPGRPLALLEDGPQAITAPEALRPRLVRAGDAEVLTLRWPVIARGPGAAIPAWSTQILAVRGRGADQVRAVEAACAYAHHDGSVVAWCHPAVAGPLQGFQRDGAPWVWRMGLGLTAAGAQAVAQARAYDELGPSS